MASANVDAMVIFGATGDLAKLETFPALAGLVERGVLDAPVIGVANSGWGVDQFRGYATASLKLNKMDPATPAAARMLSLLRYVDGDLDDPGTYERISSAIGDGQRILYYLEVPPALFGRIAEGISAVGRGAGVRIMVEKPFGYDLASARELNATLHKYFPEEAVYRVDHWLGLDWMENLLYTRFANGIIEPLLNRTYVASIQITMAEAFDVSERGWFYDRTGTIRDVLQNHMLEVLATIMADPPEGGRLAAWPRSKARLIAALRPLTADDVVRGQYAGYRDVDGVKKGSTTETYAAIRLRADTERWADVPIVIRAGKCMPVTATEVTVRFRHPPLFGRQPIHAHNTLRFRIWPETKTRIRLAGKKPGTGWEPETRELVFDEKPGSYMHPYDRLIGAALEGDGWPFAQQDTVDAAWRVLDPVLAEVTPVHPYASGTWGPKEADRLLPDRDIWYDPVD